MRLGGGIAGTLDWPISMRWIGLMWVMDLLTKGLSGVVGFYGVEEI